MFHLTTMRDVGLSGSSLGNLITLNSLSGTSLKLSMQIML